MKRILKSCICVGCLWAATAHATLVTMFGEDRSTDAAALQASHPNSTAAKNAFESMLIGAVHESFEGYASGTNVGGGLRVFDSTGATSATLTGSGQVNNATNATSPPNQQFNRFPADGSNYLMTTFPTGGSVPISIAFDNPIAGFGFFGIDIGDQGGSVTLSMSDGTTSSVALSDLRCPSPFTSPLCATIGGNDANIFFLGAYDDTGLLFNSITLTSSTPTFDRFIYDGMVAAPQVVPLPPSVVLLFSGLSGMVLLGRRKTKQS